ncbi:uncharacterized protein LOC111118655 [Crassostrea virginica]|uniref:Uncharacterized protein LOC111118655 n=1 Tax=Crassostrea virginica TaxID=6565 RepID=A0A8B8CDR9_CRAVI|nr:uncharacterized protein LOC111118655 [Crassostrea virginica]
MYTMDLKNCSFGRYGTNCSQVCGHCVVNTTCDVTGVCAYGCVSGWRGRRCLEAVMVDPYPLSTLLLSGFLAVTSVLLLLVTLELHKQIQSKKNIKIRLSSYELPGEQLIKKESEGRYGSLDRYHDIPGNFPASARGNNLSSSGYEKPPRVTDSELTGARDSSHYTIPNMAYTIVNSSENNASNSPRASSSSIGNEYTSL